MRIHAVMTVKNEADRYLKQCLMALAPAVDTIFVYDDNSTDDTMEIVTDFTDNWVPVKPGLSFMDDESAFRSDSYEQFAEWIIPEMGDWVVSIDADEMLVADSDVRPALYDLANSGVADSYSFRKAEVFDVTLGTPYVRTDGFWGDVFAPRFFKWTGETEVPPGIMGCGSIPEKAFRAAKETEKVSILHYGYLTNEDKVTKYARYFGVRGHNPRHVQSILKAPTLIKWEGPRFANV